MRFYLRLVVAFVIFLAVLALLVDYARPTRKLQGYVLNENKPVEGARVHFQDEPLFSVLSKSDGGFALPDVFSHDSRRITAWKDGFFIGSASADADPLIVNLTRLPGKDNENYAWVEPNPDQARRQNCGNCHREIYEEWSVSGHARSATNRRFLNLYDGSDWQGRPHVGWSLRGDHPDGIGVCSACHVPTAHFDTDLTKLSGDALHGVHCDFCHKIANANAEHIGFTHGRYGLELLRPHPHTLLSSSGAGVPALGGLGAKPPKGGTPTPEEVRGTTGQIFFGPLDDVDRGEDAYSPLYHESRYCASCHEGVVFGVPVYTTYSEWLESPARKEGKQCQTCHMAPTGKMTNIAPGKGGIERDPRTLSNHRFLAPSQAEMLRRSLHVSAEATSGADFVEAIVRIQTDEVGHRVPTGFVDRNLLLVVEALGPDGKLIRPSRGPKLPGFAGREWAGKAGKVYAKRLSDFEGHSPVPFWRAKPEIEDNRLIPGQAEVTEWRFPAGSSRMRLRLIYRRFWPETAKGKGWPADDMVVIEREFLIRP